MNLHFNSFSSCVSKALVSHFFVSFIITGSPCSALWNLTSVNLPQDVFVSRFVLWKNRAFLAIPRFKGNTQILSKFQPTVVEAPWPEFSVNTYKTGNTGCSTFVDNRNTIDSCESIQNAVALDVDLRGRLWILDAPVGGCWAKIVVFDLRQNNQKVASIDLKNVIKKDLEVIVIDPVFIQWEQRAYIGDPGDESIIVCSLGQRRWWRLRLLRSPGVPRIFSTDLAISRWNSILYLTGHETHDLFSLNLDRVRNENIPLAAFNNESQNTTVSWLGTKLGSSTGLLCDAKGGLHYFLITEGASVRWDIKYKLTTESHSVLLQNENVPCIRDYKMDRQKNVWGLVNPTCLQKSNKNNLASLKSRTVRIMKYYLIS